MHQSVYSGLCVGEETMFEHKKIQQLEDYFLPLASRRDKGVYFYRINQYSEATGQFLIKFYETARHFGVIIEGRIPNPDEKNLLLRRSDGTEFSAEYGLSDGEPEKMAAADEGVPEE